MAQDRKSGAVYVVDDDPDVRDSLLMLLEASGYNVKSFDSAQAFLASEAPRLPGCLIVDVRMPGMGGLELQGHLKAQNSPISVVVMTGHAEIPLAVQAMKAGAVDFLEKPLDETSLLDGVQRALQHVSQANHDAAAVQKIEERIAQLTQREKEVLDLIVAGKANKVIAYELSISPRTVEIHRARVMDKTGARNLAELVRMVLSLRK
jgi:two-component system, LuxR family, response regulator FixJ